MKKFLLIILILLVGSISFSKEEARFELNSSQMSLSEYATLYYSEGNNEEAFNKILSINEDERSAQDWLLLGNILQDNGKVADAIFMYKKSISTDKKFYKAYYNLANIYFDENKINLAIENYKLAIKYNEKFAYAHFNLGCAYIEKGEIKKAKYSFLKAIEQKNTVPEFHYNLAYVYKKLGKEKLAKQYLDNYNQLMLSQ